MNEEIRRRLAALEARVRTELVRLHMSDGSVQHIAGTRLHWDVLRELAATKGYSSVPSLNTGPARELQWLRDAERI